ncbi:MAG: flavin reductase family protein [Chloroflexota bacterium]|nr:MAG: flavin reductase family protein [Chloroflexota bacterium]
MENTSEKVEYSPRTALYPTPVVLVTSVDADGKPNIVTLAWVGIVSSDPPQIGVSVRPGRYSHAGIRERGEFTVNVPSQTILQAADLCGQVSGRDTDKFELAGLTSLAASKVKPPLIAECPVNLECVVRHQLELGAHDLFVGEVVAVHVSRSVIGEEGHIDYNRAQPIAYVQGQYWGLGVLLGRHGLSKA